MAGRNDALGSYKRQARSRGLAWELTDGDFDRLTSSDCYHCGTPPANVKRRKKYEGSEFVYSGIDRLDNTLGYTRENSAACCFDCNRYKLDLPYSEWQMIQVRNLSLTYFSRLSEDGKARVRPRCRNPEDLMTGDLLIVVPSRGRPSSIARMLDAVHATAKAQTHVMWAWTTMTLSLSGTGM